MTTPKISKAAMELADHIDEAIRGYLPSMDDTRPYFDNQCQLAIDTEVARAVAEATAPLVSVLERIAKPALGGKLQQYMAQEALDAYRKEHNA